MEFLQAANRSKTVLSSIKLTIIDLIHKLMEIEPAAEPVDSEINENTSNGVLLEVKKGVFLCKIISEFSIHLLF